MPGQHPYGLLSPVDIVNSTGLLHNPDLLGQMMMTGLLGLKPGAGYKSTLYHPIGKNKLEVPIKDMQITTAPSGSIMRRRLISPESLQGGIMYPTVYDRSAAGRKITNVGGNPVDVQLYGGPDFQRTHSPLGSVGASELGPSSRQSTAIRQLSETGKPVYMTPAVMGEHALDFSHHITDQILQVLPQSSISKASKQAFRDRMVRGVVESGKQLTFEDMPSLDSPKLSGWLNESGQNRKWFTKLMEGKEFREAGFPNIPEMRVAATAKDQLNLPEFASGGQISRVQPGLIMDGPRPHPSYPVQTPGQYVGGFGGYLPVQAMFPDWYKANLGQSGNLRRSFQMGGADRAQVMDQKWLDTVMPLYERGLLF